MGSVFVMCALSIGRSHLPMPIGLVLVPLYPNTSSDLMSRGLYKRLCSIQNSRCGLDLGPLVDLELLPAARI